MTFTRPVLHPSDRFISFLTLLNGSVSFLRTRYDIQSVTLPPFREKLNERYSENVSLFCDKELQRVKNLILSDLFIS